MYRLLAISSLLLIGDRCLAGGTLDESQVLRLLVQKPQIKEFVVQAFDMPRGAYAEIRLGSHFKHLGGARLGPYTAMVTPKGSSEFSSVVLTLCTEYQFLGRNGEPIKEDSPDLVDATDVKETLVSVQLTQASELSNRPTCP
jgi:hypothetical protein